MIVVLSYRYFWSYFGNLLQYANEGCRRLYHVEVGGSIWVQYNKLKCNALFIHEEGTSERAVETFNLQDDIFDIFLRGPQTNLTRQSTHTNDSGDEEKPKHNARRRTLNQRLFEWLQKIPVSPISGAFSLPVWTEGPFKYIPKKSTALHTVVGLVELSYCKLSIEDIYTKIMACDTYYFAAPYGVLDNYYYSRQGSLELLYDILCFQFNNDETKIDQFLLDLYNIVNKVIPKKNTFFLQSYANAGKNMFMDPLIQLCCNYGMIGNFTRYQNFPLMDCINRRIIMWNKPVLEPTATETLKLLFGGDTINIKVKFEKDAIMARTPVIVLANYNPFPKDAAFKTRMFHYHWRPMPQLKSVDKKVLPLAMYDLINPYI